MKGKRQPVFDLLILLLRKANQVWVADDGLRAESGVRFIQEHLFHRPMAYLFNRCQTLQRHYYFVKKESDMFEMILHDLKEHKKLWIPANGKRMIVKLERWLRVRLGDLAAPADPERQNARGTERAGGSSSSSD